MNSFNNTLVHVELATFSLISIDLVKVPLTARQLCYNEIVFHLLRLVIIR